MMASLDGLSETARDADIAMVFFAGHSIQVGSENYAIGVDLAELSAPVVARSSITMTEICAALEEADSGQLSGMKIYNRARLRGHLNNLQTLLTKLNPT
ncbi:putative caspase-like protein [Roseovarius sp. MBR-51]